MDEGFLIEKLSLFGLTRQEAVIYLCLFRNGELTGYEAAKLTNISRSNVYNALAGLLGKGAAYLLEGNTSKYIAVGAEEFCGNQIALLEEEKAYLIRNMPKAADIPEGYITIEGFRHIIDRIKHMLKTAEKRVYLSASCEFIEKLKEEFQRLHENGIKVVLITEKVPERIQSGTTLIYIKGEEGAEERKNQVRLIIDSAYVLTGELTGNSTDTCLYCAQKNFVTVFKEALRNEIKLIELQTADGNAQSE